MPLACGFFSWLCCCCLFDLSRLCLVLCQRSPRCSWHASVDRLLCSVCSFCPCGVFVVFMGFFCLRSCPLCWVCSLVVFFPHLACAGPSLSLALVFCASRPGPSSLRRSPLLSLLVPVCRFSACVLLFVRFPAFVSPLRCVVVPFFCRSGSLSFFFHSRLCFSCSSVCPRLVRVLRLRVSFYRLRLSRHLSFPSSLVSGIPAVFVSFFAVRLSVLCSCFRRVAVSSVLPVMFPPWELGVFACCALGCGKWGGVGCGGWLSRPTVCPSLLFCR